MVTTEKYYECEVCGYRFPTEKAAVAHERVCVQRDRKDWQGVILKSGSMAEVTGWPYRKENGRGARRHLRMMNRDGHVFVDFNSTGIDADTDGLIRPNTEEISYDEFAGSVKEAKASFADAADGAIALLLRREGE